MHSKTTLVVILVLVVLVATWYFVTTSDMRAPAPVATMSTHPTPQTPSAPAPVTRLETITPLPTSEASVAGVDMSAFTNQANQSAAWSSQDGSADAQSAANDGAAMNTSLDAEGNTVQ